MIDFKRCPDGMPCTGNCPPFGHCQRDTDPAQPVEATPETERVATLRELIAEIKQPLWRLAANARLDEYERNLHLAQTENAGHIRIEDELKADLERERMRVVGCSVAALGNWKEGDTLHADYDCVAIRDVAKLRAKFDEAQARCAELEKNDARYRWLRRNDTDAAVLFNYSHFMLTEHLKADTALDSAIDAAISAEKEILSTKETA